jgi:hypothetical protein
VAERENKEQEMVETSRLEKEKEKIYLAAFFRA